MLSSFCRLCLFERFFTMGFFTSPKLCFFLFLSLFNRVWHSFPFHYSMWVLNSCMYFWTSALRAGSHAKNTLQICSGCISACAFLMRSSAFLVHFDVFPDAFHILFFSSSCFFTVLGPNVFLNAGKRGVWSGCWLKWTLNRTAALSPGLHSNAKHRHPALLTSIRENWLPGHPQVTFRQKPKPQSSRRLQDYFMKPAQPRWPREGEQPSSPQLTSPSVKAASDLDPTSDMKESNLPNPDTSSPAERGKRAALSPAYSPDKPPFLKRHDWGEAVNKTQSDMPVTCTSPCLW